MLLPAYSLFSRVEVSPYKPTGTKGMYTLLPGLQMQDMQHTVQGRSEQDPYRHQQDHTAIESVNPCEYFGSVCAELRDRAHPTHNHRGIQKRVHKAEVGEPDIAQNPEQQRQQHQACREHAKFQHSDYECSSREKRLGMMLEKRHVQATLLSDAQF
jgi:hypothetical protein